MPDHFLPDTHRRWSTTHGGAERPKAARKDVDQWRQVTVHTRATNLGPT